MLMGQVRRETVYRRDIHSAFNSLDRDGTAVVPLVGVLGVVEFNSEEGVGYSDGSREGTRQRRQRGAGTTSGSTPRWQTQRCRDW